MGRLAQAEEHAAGGAPDFLFVQTAAGMAFDADANRLTLRGVSPVTIFFSDRPERIAGNMSTAAFVPFWSQGKDSFLTDPPNSDLSILEDGTLRQTVVVLESPVPEGDDLLYTVRIVDGEMPVLGEAVAVFNDVRHADDPALLRWGRPSLPSPGRALLTEGRDGSERTESRVQPALEARWLITIPRNRGILRDRNWEDSTEPGLRRRGRRALAAVHRRGRGARRVR